MSEKIVNLSVAKSSGPCKAIAEELRRIASEAEAGEVVGFVMLTITPDHDIVHVCYHNLSPLMVIGALERLKLMYLVDDDDG